MTFVRLGLTCALVALAMSAPRPAAAQFPDLLEVSGQYLPPTEVGDPPRLRSQVSSYDASLSVPVVLSERSFLIPGLAYHVDSVSFDRTPPEFIELRAFHSIELPVLFVRLLPKRWSLSTRLSLGLAGDFAEVDHHMLRANGMVMATRGFSDRFVGGFGALASYSFGELLPLPAIYLDWTPNRWFRIETFIPAFANVDFIPHERFAIGARFDIAGNDYAVRDERVQNNPLCAANRGARDSACLDHLAYSMGTVGLQARTRLVGTLWFGAYGGVTAFRRFELLNASGEEVPGGVQDFPRSGFFRATLTWRIPMGGDDEVSAEDDAGDLEP